MLGVADRCGLIPKLPQALASRAEANRRPSLGAIDGIRLAAMLHLVFMHFLHIIALCFRGKSFYRASPILLQPGNLRSDLDWCVFILSGFILTYVYANESHSKLKTSFRRFIVSRLSRIWPLHAALLLILLAWTFHREVWALKDFLVSLFLMQTFHPISVESWNTPSWAASCMLVFYCLLPVHLKYLGKVRRQYLLPGIFVFQILNYVLCLWFFNQFQDYSGLDKDN